MSTLDQRSVLPASVTVLYPRQDTGVPAASPTAYTVTLASLALAEMASPLATFSGSHVIYSSCVAYWTGGGAAVNDTELQALANQIATDWYRWQLAPYDLVLQGMVPWTPDGGHDIVFHHEGIDHCETRVTRQAWFDHVEFTLASGTYGSSPPGDINSWTGTTLNYINDVINYAGTSAVNFYTGTSLVLNSGTTTTLGGTTNVSSSGTLTIQSSGNLTVASGGILKLSGLTTNWVPYIGAAGLVTASNALQFDPSTYTLTVSNPGTGNAPGVLRAFQQPAGPANMANGAIAGRQEFGGLQNGTAQAFAGFTGTYGGDGTTVTGAVAAWTTSGGVVTNNMTFGSNGSTDWAQQALSLDNLFDQSTGITVVAIGTCDIGAALGHFIDISGTTTITSFGSSAQVGDFRWCRFTAALTLTHNATSLILPGAANITTAASDRAGVVYLGSGNWLCLWYVRASAPPVSGTNTGDQTITLTGDVTGSGTGSFATTVAKIAGTTVSGTTGTTNAVFSASPTLTGVPLAPTAAGGTNTTQIATTAFVAAAVSGAVSGLNYKGATDCSGNPNYPSAVKGDLYVVSVAGKIGGASGTSVDVGDWYICEADNAGGSEASVGSSWGHMEHNLVGALLASNNLSDVASASTALTNLGATTVGSNLFTLTNPGSVTFPRINADNTVTTRSAANYRTDLGVGTGDSPTLTGLNLSGLTASKYVVTDGSKNLASQTGVPTTDLTGTVTNAQLAGSIATSKLTDGSLFIKSDGSVAFGADQSLGSHKLTNVTDPTLAQDAATKNYVDSQIALQPVKLECQAATTAALAAATYNNGSSGVGATLTLTVAAVLVLDGYTPALNDRLLIKNQAAPAQNGLYYLSTVGVLGVTQAVLTRTTDFDQQAEVTDGAFVFVQNGTTNGATGWLCNTFGTVTFGTTAINWVEDTGSGTYTGTTNQVAVSGSNVISLTGPFGFTTQTAHGILLGQGTSAITAVAVGTDGQLLVGQSAADPAWKTLSGPVSISATGVTAVASAAALSISGQTGLLTVTGLASTSRIKTVRDAADTLLELGGSYTPTGTWTNLPLTTPAITGLATGSGVSSAATASTLASRDANGNLSAVNILEGFTTTATAAGTTTLTVGSTRQQVFTGSTTQTCKLPVATTLVNGQSFLVVNNSTGVVTVQTSGSNTLLAMVANSQALYTCVDTTGGTGTASWNAEYTGFTAVTGTGSNVLGTAPTIAGGTHTALTSLGIRSTGAAFDLTLATSEVLTAGRTLSIVLNDAARTLTISASATISGTNTGDQTTVSGNAGTATALANARAIYGNNFDGTAALAQIIASTYGGTGNGFAKLSGPATSEKTFTLPNASAAILTDNAAVTVAQGGSGLTSLPYNQPFRLTTETNVPISSSDRTAQTSVRLSQMTGGLVWLWDGSRIVGYAMTADITAGGSLGTLTSGKPYDVFLYYNSGTPTMELLVWTNDTTRATAITMQNGLPCKSGDATRLLVGTIYTTSTTTTEDSNQNRYVSSYWNPVPRPLTLVSSVSGSGQAVTAPTGPAQIGSEQVNWVSTNAGYMTQSHWTLLAQPGSGGVSVIGLGLDSTSSPTATGATGDQTGTTSAQHAHYAGAAGAGRHYLAGLVKTITATITYYGANQGYNYGFNGFVMG